MIEPQLSKPQLYGKYAAVVTQSDPATGRVKVQVPILYGAVEMPAWCLPCWPPKGTVTFTVNFPSGGSANFNVVTAWTPPPVGTGVWVEFMCGDPDYPVWVGTYEVVT